MSVAELIVLGPGEGKTAAAASANPRRQWLRGPAITEIDSPHVRSGRCLIIEPITGLLDETGRRMQLRMENIAPDRVPAVAST